jgi:membrane associated rhomboid family serine protease
MIPLHDNIPTRRFPVVSVMLIAVNVIAFLVDRLTGHTEMALVETPRGLFQVPHFVGGLTGQYAMVPGDVTGNPAAAWLTIFTSMFLHANWLHIGGNMLYLWVFGNNVEDTLGRFRFLLFYLFCGFTAAMAQILSGPQSTVPTIGASGAVAGLMGAYLILFPNAEILSVVPIVFISALMEVPAILVIGFWALLQFVNASWLGGGGLLDRSGGVAYFAHIGGFVAGLTVILLLGGQRLVERRRYRRDDDGYIR